LRLWLLPLVAGAALLKEVLPRMQTAPLKMADQVVAVPTRAG